jgi:hypothetical protein
VSAVSAVSAARTECRRAASAESVSIGVQYNSAHNTEYRAYSVDASAVTVGAACKVFNSGCIHRGPTLGKRLCVYVCGCVCGRVCVCDWERDRMKSE